MNNAFRKLGHLSAVSLLMFPTCGVLAQAENLPSRLFVWGNGGNLFFGKGDAMIPIKNNANSLTFFDFTSKYGKDNGGLLSLGMGNRTIFSNDILLGAYLFGDYNKTSFANNFTIINPGIEAMTNYWDAHVNGYIPTGKKSKSIAYFTGSQLGFSNATFFTEHRQYDKLFSWLENVGAGADCEIGRTFFSLNQTRVFAGAYYFSPQYSSDIRGVEYGMEIPLRYPGMQVGLRGTYDNLFQNTLAVTLRVAFGGLEHSQMPDIHQRWLDQIPRHIGTLHSGDGIPTEESITYSGQNALVLDNIWFFNAGGTPSAVDGYQSCTFEHPCFGLAQTQIDSINALAPNANFYFSPGTYNNPTVGTAFSFYNGQNISGRTSNFMQLAVGNERAFLNDSLVLNGNNYVNNVRVFANSELNIETAGMEIPIKTGIFVPTSASGPVSVYNTDITSNATLNAAAVINNSSTSLNINNSTLTANLSNIPGAVIIGAGNVSSGTININGSSIHVTQSDLVNNFNVVFGIVNNENGIINVNSTDITVNSFNAGLTAGALNNSTVGSGIINIVGSNFSVLSDNSSLTADVFNQANNLSGVGGTVNIDHSSLMSTSLNNSGGVGSGIFNTAQSTVNVSNSVIVSSGNDGIITGILNSDPQSTVNLLNNSISVYLSGTAFGAPIFNGGILNDNGGNQCFQDGASVPC